MRKNLKIKTSREFLKKDFPENLLPFKKLVKKDKRYIQDKLSLFKRIKRRIRKVEDFLQSKQLGNQNKTCFLFSPEQVKNDLLRIQKNAQSGSDFLFKIKEKKKVSILYGNISKKSFQKAYQQALKKRGRINENLILYFETRLDTILFRICFAKTILGARQLISHKLIFVNGKPINIPSYQVKPGDIITIDKNKKNKIVELILKNLKQNVNSRRFRFLISLKVLKKNLLSNDLSNFLTGNLQRKIPSGSSKVQKKVFFESQLDRLLRKINFKLKKGLLVTRKRNTKKRIWFMETLVRLNTLKNLLEKTYINLKKMNETSFSITNKRIQKILDLNIKKVMFRKPSRYHTISSMRINAMKPLNVEVSYRTMSAIVLYPPQKVTYPTIVNIDLFSRSLGKK